MSESSARLPHLGIILPDDPIKSEMYTLDSLLRDHGRSDVQTTTVLSKMMGGHVAEDLYRTGDPGVIAPPARELAACGCGAIVWACTSGSFIGGLAWARSQQRGLEETAGVPATSTTLAFLAALQHRGNSKVHVLGAYPEPVTRAFLGCLEADGRKIGAWACLDTPDGPSSFVLDLAAELDRFMDRVPDDGAPILIPDTAINSLSLIPELEHRSGHPVFAANQVSLWHGLELLGVSARIEGAGSLFG